MYNPFAMVRESWSRGFRQFSNLPFVFILIAFIVYFWINGQAHFGSSWSSTYGDLILIYLVMVIVFLLYSRRSTQKEMKRPLKNSMSTFALFFIGTYMVLFLVSITGAISPGAIDPSLFWPVVIIQMMIATSEELMFRGVLLEVLPWGIVSSSALFAIWHSAAYGVTWYDWSWTTFPWSAFLFAFVIGVIFALIVKQKQWGLPGAISVHMCYNLVISGVFVTFSQL